MKKIVTLLVIVLINVDIFKNRKKMNKIVSLFFVVLNIDTYVYEQQIEWHVLIREICFFLNNCSETVEI